MLNIVGIPITNVTLRSQMTSNTTNLWCWCGAQDQPGGLTGSTNLSLGGFSGQIERWPLGAATPMWYRQFVALESQIRVQGSYDDRSEAMKANRALRTAVAALQETLISIDDDPIRANLSLQSAPRQGGAGPVTAS